MNTNYKMRVLTILKQLTLKIAPRLSPQKEENQEWQASYGITHDEVDVSLMDGDVCSQLCSIFKWMGDCQVCAWMMVSKMEVWRDFNIMMVFWQFLGSQNNIITLIKGG